MRRLSGLFKSNNSVVAAKQISLYGIVPYPSSVENILQITESDYLESLVGGALIRNEANPNLTIPNIFDLLIKLDELKLPLLKEKEDFTNPSGLWSYQNEFPDLSQINQKLELIELRIQECITAASKEFTIDANAAQNQIRNSSFKGLVNFLSLSNRDYNPNSLQGLRSSVANTITANFANAKKRLSQINLHAIVNPTKQDLLSIILTAIEADLSEVQTNTLFNVILNPDRIESKNITQPFNINVADAKLFCDVIADLEPSNQTSVAYKSYTRPRGGYLYDPVFDEFSRWLSPLIKSNFSFSTPEEHIVAYQNTIENLLKESYKKQDFLIETLLNIDPIQDRQLAIPTIPIFLNKIFLSHFIEFRKTLPGENLRLGRCLWLKLQNVNNSLTIKTHSTPQVQTKLMDLPNLRERLNDKQTELLLFLKTVATEKLTQPQVEDFANYLRIDEASHNDLKAILNYIGSVRFGEGTYTNNGEEESDDIINCVKFLYYSDKDIALFNVNDTSTAGIKRSIERASIGNREFLQLHDNLKPFLERAIFTFNTRFLERLLAAERLPDAERMAPETDEEKRNYDNALLGGTILLGALTKHLTTQSEPPKEIPTDSPEKKVVELTKNLKSFEAFKKSISESDSANKTIILNYGKLGAFQASDYPNATRIVLFKQDPANPNLNSSLVLNRASPATTFEAHFISEVDGTPGWDIYGGLYGDQWHSYSSSNSSTYKTQELHLSAADKNQLDSIREHGFEIDKNQILESKVKSSEDLKTLVVTTKDYLRGLDVAEAFLLETTSAFEPKTKTQLIAAEIDRLIKSGYKLNLVRLDDEFALTTQDKSALRIAENFSFTLEIAKGENSLLGDGTVTSLAIPESGITTDTNFTSVSGAIPGTIKFKIDLDNIDEVKSLAEELAKLKHKKLAKPLREIYKTRGSGKELVPSFAPTVNPYSVSSVLKFGALALAGLGQNQLLIGQSPAVGGLTPYNHTTALSTGQSPLFQIEHFSPSVATFDIDFFKGFSESYLLNPVYLQLPSLPYPDFSKLKIDSITEEIEGLIQNGKKLNITCKHNPALGSGEKYTASNEEFLLTIEVEGEELKSLHNLNAHETAVLNEKLTELKLRELAKQSAGALPSPSFKFDFADLKTPPQHHPVSTSQVTPFFTDPLIAKVAAEQKLQALDIQRQALENIQSQIDSLTARIAPTTVIVENAALEKIITNQSYAGLNAEEIRKIIAQKSAELGDNVIFQRLDREIDTKQADPIPAPNYLATLTSEEASFLTPEMKAQIAALENKFGELQSDLVKQELQKEHDDLKIKSLAELTLIELTPAANALRILLANSPTIARNTRKITEEITALELPKDTRTPLQSRLREKFSFITEEKIDELAAGIVNIKSNPKYQEKAAQVRASFTTNHQVNAASHDVANLLKNLTAEQKLLLEGNQDFLSLQRDFANLQTQETKLFDLGLEAELSKMEVELRLEEVQKLFDDANAEYNQTTRNLQKEIESLKEKSGKFKVTPAEEIVVQNLQTEFSLTAEEIRTIIPQELERLSYSTVDYNNELSRLTAKFQEDAARIRTENSAQTQRLRASESLFDQTQKDKITVLENEYKAQNFELLRQQFEVDAIDLEAKSLLEISRTRIQAEQQRQSAQDLLHEKGDKALKEAQEISASQTAILQEKIAELGDLSEAALRAKVIKQIPAELRTYYLDEILKAGREAVYGNDIFKSKKAETEARHVEFERESAKIVQIEEGKSLLSAQIAEIEILKTTLAELEDKLSQEQLAKAIFDLESSFLADYAIATVTYKNSVENAQSQIGLLKEKITPLKNPEETTLENIISDQNFAGLNAEAIKSIIAQESQARKQDAALRQAQIQKPQYLANLTAEQASFLTPEMRKNIGDLENEFEKLQSDFAQQELQKERNIVTARELTATTLVRLTPAAEALQALLRDSAAIDSRFEAIPKEIANLESPKTIITQVKERLQEKFNFIDDAKIDELAAGITGIKSNPQYQAKEHQTRELLLAESKVSDTDRNLISNFSEEQKLLFAGNQDVISLGEKLETLKIQETKLLALKLQEMEVGLRVEEVQELVNKAASSQKEMAQNLRARIENLHDRDSLQIKESVVQQIQANFSATPNLLAPDEINQIITDEFLGKELLRLESELDASGKEYNKKLAQLHHNYGEDLNKIDVEKSQTDLLTAAEKQEIENSKNEYKAKLKRQFEADEADLNIKFLTESSIKRINDNVSAVVNYVDAAKETLQQKISALQNITIAIPNDEETNEILLKKLQPRFTKIDPDILERMIGENVKDFTPGKKFKDGSANHKRKLDKELEKVQNETPKYPDLNFERSQLLTSQRKESLGLTDLENKYKALRSKQLLDGFQLDQHHLKVAEIETDISAKLKEMEKVSLLQKEQQRQAEEKQANIDDITLEISEEEESHQPSMATTDTSTPSVNLAPPAPKHVKKAAPTQVDKARLVPQPAQSSTTTKTTTATINLTIPTPPPAKPPRIKKGTEKQKQEEEKKKEENSYSGASYFGAGALTTALIAAGIKISDSKEEETAATAIPKTSSSTAPTQPESIHDVITKINKNSERDQSKNSKTYHTPHWYNNKKLVKVLQKIANSKYDFENDFARLEKALNSAENQNNADIKLLKLNIGDLSVLDKIDNLSVKRAGNSIDEIHHSRKHLKAMIDLIPKDKKTREDFFKISRDKNFNLKITPAKNPTHAKGKPFLQKVDKTIKP
ncbi:MAG: hypothetical protein V4694_00080 [Pseudomonadota bacterium]